MSWEAYDIINAWHDIKFKMIKNLGTMLLKQTVLLEYFIARNVLLEYLNVHINIVV